MLKLTSTLYSQRTFTEQMRDAYQAGQQFAESPGSAANLLMNWFIKKEREWMNRSRGKGPGQWNCFSCGQYVSDGGQKRTYQQKTVTLCPNCVGWFDRQFGLANQTSQPQPYKAQPTSTPAPASPKIMGN